MLAHMGKPAPPTLENFAKAFSGNWLAWMSGAPSVPFAIYALFAPEQQKALFVALAFLCVLLAAFWVWRKERKAALAVFQQYERKLVA